MVQDELISKMSKLADNKSRVCLGNKHLANSLSSRDWPAAGRTVEITKLSSSTSTVRVRTETTMTTRTTNRIMLVREARVGHLRKGVSPRTSFGPAAVVSSMLVTTISVEPVRSFRTDLTPPAPSSVPLIDSIPSHSRKLQAMGDLVGSLLTKKL